MTIYEASKKAIEEDAMDGTEKNRLLNEWQDSNSKARLAIATFLLKTLNESNGKLSLKDVAFIFLFGIRIGQVLRDTK